MRYPAENSRSGRSGRGRKIQFNSLSSAQLLRKIDFEHRRPGHDRRRQKVPRDSSRVPSGHNGDDRRGQNRRFGVVGHRRAFRVRNGDFRVFECGEGDKSIFCLFYNYYFKRFFRCFRMIFFHFKSLF